MIHSSAGLKANLLRALFACIFAQFLCSTSAQAWWDKIYTIRQPVNIDTTSAGAEVSGPIGSATVLVRLHEGNFQFMQASEDGSDLRFIAEDDKTPLAYHIEKYDGLLNEAFVWVKVPEVKPGAKTTFWLYYGTTAAAPAGAADPKASYDAETVLVYHFGERATPPSDATGNGPTAATAGIPVEGALVGTGLRLSGKSGIAIPANDKLTWAAGSPLTTSVWVKPATLQGRQVVLAYKEAVDAVTIGVEDGIPFAEVINAAGTVRTPAAEALAPGAWHHLAFVSAPGRLELFVNGRSFGTVAATLPAMNSGLTLGSLPGEQEDAKGFAGEVDELIVAKGARSPGNIQFAALAQGTSEAAARLVVLGEVAGGTAGHSEMLEHVMLFGDIAKNMMFDGWIAVGVCVIMIIFGWGVAITKFGYLNSIQKGSDAFMKQWKHVSSDLTALDHNDEHSIKSLGGADKKTLKQIHMSPLYHLYHIGSEEIRHRVGNGRDKSKGLSARSIQAIKASLETGLVRENQRMNKGLIFLTISIAGGPYVGLLGTVVGVMITFAIIAKTGEVEVNSIAPGIASALLATVAGLIVAIPALFIYSYLSSRIKDLIASMQVFNDEFVAKMAEFYPTPSDIGHAPLPRETAPLNGTTEAQPALANHAS